MAQRNIKQKYPASFPELRFNGRLREFSDYTDEQRAAVVWAWLVDGKFTRVIDKEILGEDPDISKGYDSMNICHYLGIYAPHQGFFKGCNQIQVIRYLLNYASTDSRFYQLLYYVSLHNPVTDNNFDTVSPHELQIINQLPYDRDQYWLRRNLLTGVKEQQMDARLLLLPDVKDTGHILINHVFTEYTNKTVQTAIKDVYDHTCQICGHQHHDSQWNQNLLRMDKWLHMDSDIYFINPISDNGSYKKANMLCLCSECSRKLKEGQFRLVEKKGSILCLDEQNGQKEYLTMKHQITLAG